MATYLEDRFRFRTNDLMEVHRILETLRSDFEQKAQILVGQWLVNKAIEKFDMWHYFGSGRTMSNGLSPMVAAYAAFSMEQRAGAQQRPDSDFSCTMLLFPVDMLLFPVEPEKPPTVGSLVILGCLTTRQMAYMDYVRQQWWYESFSEEASLEGAALEERQRLWRLALPEPGAIPDLCGWVVPITLHAPRFAPDREHCIVPNGPEVWERRAERIAQHDLFEAFCAKYDHIDRGNEAAAFGLFGAWLQSDEGQSSQRLQIEIVKASLVPELTLELLHEIVTEESPEPSAAAHS